MTSFLIVLGLILVVGGFIFIFWARYIWPWSDQEPFENQTKNDLWNYFLPYLFGVAILAAIVGASILKKNGIDFAWPSE
jgi:hypothetical protein